MPSEPFTHREIEALHGSIRDLTTTIEHLRTEMASTYVRKDVLQPQLDEIRGDVKSHEDWLTWAQRIVIGLVILALVGLVVTVGGGR